MRITHRICDALGRFPAAAMELSSGTGDALVLTRRPDMDAHESFSYALLELLDEAELRCLIEDITPERFSSRESDELLR